MGGLVIVVPSFSVVAFPSRLVLAYANLEFVAAWVCSVVAPCTSCISKAVISTSSVHISFTIFMAVTNCRKV